MQIRQMLDRQVGEFAICWEWFTFLTWERFWKGFEKNPGTYLQKAQVPIISSNDLNYKMVDYNQNLKYSIIFFLEELSVVRFVRVAKKWSKIGMYHVKSEICCRTLTITLLYFSPQMIFGAKFFFCPIFFFFADQRPVIWFYSRRLTTIMISISRSMSEISFLSLDSFFRSLFKRPSLESE